MSLLGADVDQLDDLAREFGAAAKLLTSAEVGIAGLLPQTWWRGSIADKFRTDFSQHGARSLRVACDSLVTLQTRLSSEADEQRASSAAMTVQVGSAASSVGTPGRSSDFADPLVQPDNQARPGAAVSGYRPGPAAVESWRLKGNAVVGLTKILNIGANSKAELVKLEDNSYRLRLEGGGQAGVALPGFANLYAGKADSVTFDLSAQELAGLSGNGLLLPDGALPEGVTGTYAEMDLLDNVSAIGVNGLLEGALKNLPVLIPAPAMSELLDVQIPHSLDFTGSATNGMELRRSADGSWEVATSSSVAGMRHNETDTASVFGPLGGIVDRLTKVEINETDTTASGLDLKHERVYNLASGEIHTIDTTTHTSYRATGYAVDIGLGTPSQQSADIDFEVAKIQAGEAKSVSNRTVRNAEGVVVDASVSRSVADFGDVDLDAVIAGTASRFDHRTYQQH